MESSLENVRCEAVDRLCAYVENTSEEMKASIEDELCCPWMMLNMLFAMKVDGGQGSGDVIRLLEGYMKMLPDTRDKERIYVSDADADMATMSGTTALAIWKKMAERSDYGVVAGIYRDIDELADCVGKDLDISRKDALQLVKEDNGFRYFAVDPVGLVLLSCGN